MIPLFSLGHVWLATSREHSKRELNGEGEGK